MSVRQIDVLFEAETIAARVDAIAHDVIGLLGREPYLVCVLTGGFVFAADLLRALGRAQAAPGLGFIGLSSYGAGTRSSGEAKLTFEDVADISGREVLLVDDIYETGRTLERARALLLSRGARRVFTCVLLDKRGRRQSALDPDLFGFECPDRFVVGYGLDLDGRYRELPFVGALQD